MLKRRVSEDKFEVCPLKFRFLILRDVCLVTLDCYTTSSVVGKWASLSVGARGSLGRFPAEALAIRDNI